MIIITSYLPPLYLNQIISGEIISQEQILCTYHLQTFTLFQKTCYIGWILKQVKNLFSDLKLTSDKL